MVSESKVGHRLAEVPAPEMTTYMVGPRIQEDLANNFAAMTANNLAHVVMLARQGIIDRGAARALLMAVEDIRKEGPGKLPLDLEREDLYFNYEHAVITRVGPDIGGQMHTGRSRNDLGAAVTAVRFRRLVMAMVDGALATRAALLELASLHLNTVMPGYTHLQPAQPITLAHYLTAVEAGLSRDTDRLLAALLRANRSPMGAAALAGTGYPIDREMTAELLGFDSVSVNTLDCVASRDYLLEALAAAAIMGTTLSRFAQDLYVWYTNEFGMIDFRDRVTGTSSIMPQKKNPILLENIRGRTAHALGAFTAAVAGIRSTPYTNTVDGNREALHGAWSALEESRISLDLAKLAVENLVVRKELMTERCQTNFSTVTELADTLVTEWGISFRQAHEIVGGVVRTCLEKGLGVKDIDGALVSKVALDDEGISKAVSTAVVRKALDPVENVRVRSHPGGPAPDAVRAMIKTAEAGVLGHREALSSFRQRLQTREAKLASRVRELCEA